MNKQKFIDLLVSTEKVTETDFSALEQITGRYPFFQSGHTVLAKASRILKSSGSPKKLATAAIYSTNRNLFKQYMVSGIKSVAPPNAASTINRKAPTVTNQSTRKAPELLSNDEQNELIKDIYKNLEEWKSSRDQYLEFDKAHPEDIIIEEIHHEENHVETLKSQVAKEVEAEDGAHVEKADFEPKKSDAEILDELKTQVAKEALKEEVEELEKELSRPKNSSNETAEPSDLKDIPEISIDDQETSGSVYSFGKPIPEPESLPDTLEEKLAAKLPKPESLPDIEEKELVDQLPEIDIDDTGELKEQSVNTDTSLPEPEREALEETTNNTAEETTSKPLVEKDLPEIEDLDDSNQDIISTEELSAIVDQISDDAEESASEEKTVIEDLPEDNTSDLESQIDSMSVSTEPETEEETLDKVENLENPIKSNDITEEADDDTPSELSQKVDLEDVKKLDPEEVFDADFSDEDIDFGSKGTQQEPVEAKKTVSKADSLESLSSEELDSFEIEPSLEGLPTEMNQAPDKNKSEQALGDIDKQKSDLQLLPGGGSKGEKKFRLSVMKRPHNFTKPKKVLNARETREAQNKEEAKKPKIKEVTPQAEDTVAKKNPAASTGKKTTATKKTVSKSTQKETPKPTKTTTRKTKAKKDTETSKTTAKKTKTTTKSKKKEEPKEDDTESVKKKVVTRKKNDDTLDHQSIIDSFIETNPSIKINKEAATDIDNTVDLTVDSSEFPQELITENLATILKNQGKTERAIEIYEKLILNNPEKKAYFASQIEKLKKN